MFSRIRLAATVFLSAYLVFQVQPMIARFILPWFGGGPAVWTTCMLFFQTMLLAGYAYAHLISARLTPRAQFILHMAVLGLSMGLLPITPSDHWRPGGGDDPTLRILLLLVCTVGLPYLIVSSTAPLLQRWFSILQKGRSPFRLYALSNIGSLLGLVGYPFVVEPLLGLRRQTLGWSAGYVVFALLCAASGWGLLRYRGEAVRAADPVDEAENDARRSSGLDLWALWTALPAVASVMLLAITNQTTQDVAVIPFLWVLPLSLYILTFIVTFGSDRLYDRRIWYPLLVLALGALTFHISIGLVDDLVQEIALYNGTLFAVCMVCHGELVRLRPSARRLTSFYLMVALGGALGGFLVTIVAPRVFNGFWELHIGLVLALLLAGLCLYRILRESRKRTGLRVAVVVLTLTGALVMGWMLSEDIADHSVEAIAAVRDFYGVLRVKEEGNPRDPMWQRRLYHGEIRHGVQFLQPGRRNMRVGYYSARSGVGIAIDHLHEHGGPDGGRASLNIGVVGLGAGVMAASALPGDRMRFYEIDPTVERLARRYFTFLKDCPATVDVVLGDARVSMERELKDGTARRFDVLAIDAFSGDAIPVHLMTREAIELYLRYLAPNGVLALHISNQNLDLSPVVRGIARELRRPAAYTKNLEARELGIDRATWVLITTNRGVIDDPRTVEQTRDWPEVDREYIVWTDDWNNLFQVLE
jgi:hypothetical protein